MTQASVPAPTFVASIPKAWRYSAARSERDPDRQITSKGASARSSSTRSGTSSSGTRTAPGTWPSTYSSGRRTSISTRPVGRRSASSSTVISCTATLVRLREIARAVHVAENVRVRKVDPTDVDRLERPVDGPLPGRERLPEQGGAPAHSVDGAQGMGAVGDGGGGGAAADGLGQARPGRGLDAREV